MRGPLLLPRRLSRGGTVGVAALSGPVRDEALRSGCAALGAMGLRVRVAGRTGPGFGPLGLAGSDAERLEAWRDLLLDPEVEAIVLARGGYGITRLLPLVDPEEVRAHPKLHCGFSDATALSSFLLGRCSIPSLHGPMVAADLAKPLDPLSARFFPSALLGEAPRDLETPGADVLVPGTARGRLVGGCLSMLAALAGTPEQPDTEGALLLVEEVGEEAYRVDRMLGTLARAGLFDKLAGVLVGHMTRVTFGGRAEPGRLREALLDRFAPLGVPVAAGLPFGHGSPNVALPIGAAARWDGAALRLEVEEGIVA